MSEAISSRPACCNGIPPVDAEPYLTSIRETIAVSGHPTLLTGLLDTSPRTACLQHPGRPCVEGLQIQTVRESPRREMRAGDSLMTPSPVVLQYANGAPANGNHVTRCFQPRSAWSSGSPSYRSASTESLYQAGTPGPADFVRTGAPAPGAGCRCPQPTCAGSGNLGTRLACDSGTSAQQRSGLQRSIARFHLQSDN